MSGGVLLELSPETTNKSAFGEAVKGLLGKKALVSSLQPMCSLEIRDLYCFAGKVEVEEEIKRECSEVTNVRIDITYVNAGLSRVREVSEHYARTLFNRGKIEIG